MKFAKGGDYRFSFRVTSPSKKLAIELLIDDVSAGVLPIRPTMSDNGGSIWGETWTNWETQSGITAHFEADRVYMVKIVFIDPTNVGSDFSFFEVRPVADRRKREN